MAFYVLVWKNELLMEGIPRVGLKRDGVFLFKVGNRRRWSSGSHMHTIGTIDDTLLHFM